VGLIDRNNPYFWQVQLLVRLMPIISREDCFALKGGTAINLFVRDLPRLSVDIDLVYLPIEDRESSLAKVDEALRRIKTAIETEVTGSRVHWPNASAANRLFVDASNARVKIELSPVLRGSVFEPERRPVRPVVEDQFGYAESLVLAIPDLYAGKICAALDRQHPRDLYDVKLLMETDGISDDIRRCFLVYLISHNRQMAELLAPNRKDIRKTFVSEFQSMTLEPVTVEGLEEVRERLVATLQASLTAVEKDFLVSFKSGSPNWSLLGLPHVQDLPAVRWKLQNLQKMSTKQFAGALAALKRALGN